MVSTVKYSLIYTQKSKVFSYAELPNSRKAGTIVFGDILGVFFYYNQSSCFSRCQKHPCLCLCHSSKLCVRSHMCTEKGRWLPAASLAVSCPKVWSEGVFRIRSIHLLVAGVQGDWREKWTRGFPVCRCSWDLEEEASLHRRWQRKELLKRQRRLPLLPSACE